MLSPTETYWENTGEEIVPTCQAALTPAGALRLKQSEDNGDGSDMLVLLARKIYRKMCATSSSSNTWKLHNIELSDKMGCKSYSGGKTEGIT